MQTNKLFKFYNVSVIGPIFPTPRVFGPLVFLSVLALFDFVGPCLAVTQTPLMLFY